MDKELLEILEKGEIVKLKLYLENKGDIKKRDEDNRTVMHEAAKHGHLEIIECLLKNGAKLENKDKYDETPLYEAVRFDHLPVVKFLLKNGENVGNKNSHGQTVFHMAAQYGHVDIVEFLLKNGARMEDKDIDGSTALHLAASSDSVSVVDYLLKNGARLEDKNDDGDTALHEAAALGYLPLVKCLLHHGGLIEDKNKRGNTILHLAARFGHLPVVEFLLKHGAKVLNENDEGNTALHMAAGSAHILVIEHLLKYGAKVDDKNGKGNNALHVAAEEGHLSAVEFFLNHGANVEERNNNCETALHLAAFYNRSSVVEYLLNCPDVNINEQNNAGDTALSLSVKKEDNPNFFISYLKTRWGDKTNLVSLFLRKGAYIDILLNNGRSALSEASRDYGGKVSLLLKSSEELLNLTSVGLNHSAQSKQIKEKLDILGRSINGRQVKSGNTALHIAILCKQTDVVRMLLEQGPDVLIKNHCGESSLTLLQQSYSNEPYLISLAMLCALNQIEETLSFQKKYKIFLNPPEIKKQVVEQQKLEIKEQKEVKENKEQKEIRETKKMDEHQIFLSVNKQVLDQCEQYLDDIETCLQKLSDEKRFEIGFALGKLLSNRNHCLFSPRRAYQFLSYIAEPKFSQNSKFSETHKIMLELLVSKSIIFEIEGLSGEPNPVSVSVELDGHSTIESKESESHRLFCIIKHILYSKSEHDDALGKYISHYIQETGSVMGLKDVHDKSIPSQLALIKSFKEQSELLRKREQELKAREAREKALEEMLKKKELELKRLQDELNSLNVQNSQNLASSEAASSQAQDLTDSRNLKFR